MRGQLSGLTKQVRDLPVDRREFTDSVNVIRSVQRRLPKGPFEVVVNIVLRINKIESQPCAECVDVEERLRVEKAGDRFKVRNSIGIFLVKN